MYVYCGGTVAVPDCAILPFFRGRSLKIEVRGRLLELCGTA